MRVIVIYIILFFTAGILRAQDERQVNGLLNDFGQRRANLVLLEFNYAIGGPSFPDDAFTAQMAPTYNPELRYGFARYYDKFDLETIFRYNSEFTFIGNLSSHFKPGGRPDGVTTDTWRFGFALADGYGYIRDGEATAILYHESSLIWSSTDVEIYPLTSAADRDLLAECDETFRFGTMFGSGVKLRAWEGIWIDAGYQHQIVFPRHVVFHWVGSAALEMGLLRWIGYYEKDLISMHGELFPALNLLYKTAVSLIFYELRRDHSNWPFGEKNAPLSFDQFKIGMTLLL